MWYGMYGTGSGTHCVLDKETSFIPRPRNLSTEIMAGLVRRIISTPNAPKALGPYSQAVAVGNTMYLSGMIGIDPATSKLVDGISAQTTQVFKNIGAVLASQNISFENVVKTTVLLANIADYGAVNEIYASFFKTSFPARAAYQAAALPANALVEIECIAILGELVNAEGLKL